MDYTFGKEYKLCSQTVIDSLFESGEQFKAYPFIVRFLETELRTDKPFQLVISAPKRIFRFAHQRNRAKRICKEAIRHHKENLESYLRDNGKQLALFVVYTSRSELGHEKLNHQTEKMFQKLILQLKEHD